MLRFHICVEDFFVSYKRRPHILKRFVVMGYLLYVKKIKKRSFNNVNVISNSYFAQLWNKFGRYKPQLLQIWHTSYAYDSAVFYIIIWYRCISFIFLKS